jgi:hypothetical protein
MRSMMLVVDGDRWGCGLRDSLEWLQLEELVLQQEGKETVDPPLSTGGRSGSASGSMLVSTGRISSPGTRGDDRCLSGAERLKKGSSAKEGSAGTIDPRGIGLPNSGKGS